MISMIHSTLFLFLILNAIHPSNAGAGTAALLLNCGGSPGTADGRPWEPDDKYLVMGASSTTAAKADVQDPSLPSDIPYMSARIFKSEATYRLRLQNSTSRTLLRLHFYPSSYPNLNISNSYFSVVAAGVTLLNNFSASIAAEALSQAYFIKEYYLPPSDSPTLNVTLKPSDQQPVPSFAFLNGVEVISMPGALFSEDPTVAGSGSDDDSDGFDTSVTIPIARSSMENMYRLNVGGQYIAPVNDSLMRSWYDDSLYIYGAGRGIAWHANFTIEYKGLPSFIAPIDVYQSYRSMGAFVDVNRNSNLTWIFQVDPDFMYLLRFHWCDSEMTKPNQRVFDVFINNKTATSEVDLYAMTGSKATPTKKDYVVQINKTTEELWVALHPTDKTKAEFADVLLNGLEIFKLSDKAKANLAGPNPTISDLMKKYQESQVSSRSFEKENNSRLAVLITGAAGGMAAIGLGAAVFICTHSKRRRNPKGEAFSTWLPISWNSSSSNTRSTNCSSSSQCGATTTTISTDAASNCRYFSLLEIKNATKNFDDSNVIGVGGFGKVYKGVVDGNTKVAVKRSNPSSEQGVNEFQTEIEMLSRLRHRHLVSLIGFCMENGEMILVYDYMGNGTLREHLYKGNKIILTWKQRLEICIGAARGLHYLHTGARYTIIHRDVKTTNILVDDKWVAKVSDFGLSKTGPNMNKGHVSTVVKGSFGYLDPEYFRRQQLTEKSDVYSFGVVLFEVLCARPALNPSLPKEQVSLADWALRCTRNNAIEEIIDPQIKGQISPEGLKKYTDTAEKCLSDHGVERPSMGDVLWNLEFTLQLHDNPDDKREETRNMDSVDLESIDEQKIDHDSLIAMHKNTLSLIDEEDQENLPPDSADCVFSQIVNPRGR